MGKAVVKFNGVTLAGNSPVVWRFVTGTQPYQTFFTVNKRDLTRIEGSFGNPSELLIRNAAGDETVIKEVYALHLVASDSPNRISFLVSDKRWLWPYKLIVRDFNIPRKTGRRTALNPTDLVENQVIGDKFDYLEYSLQGGEISWTAQEAVKVVMGLLDEVAGGAEHAIEGFPIEDEGSAGQFTLQNVTLVDRGDIAIGRLLSYIPGADVRIDPDGRAVVMDTTDLAATEQHFATLPVTTWAGQVATIIDRRVLRPKTVRVHYQREIECIFDYSDSFTGTTQGRPGRNTPYLENVIPTTDPTTAITVFDPVIGGTVPTNVPAGTWVGFRDWLVAMDLTKPAASAPWTFDTLKIYWVAGALDGVLGGRRDILDGADIRNTSLRIQNLKHHFRQTFRINRRFMERIRDVFAMRVGLLDPVTGQRAPAAAWSQACVVVNDKGKYIVPRRNPDDIIGMYVNLDHFPALGTKTIEAPVGPTRVNILDHDLGIFRLEWIFSPYGTDESFIPSLISPKPPVRNLKLQDTEPMGPAMRIEGGTNGIFLSSSLNTKVILTIIPSAPNNARQFHRVDVQAEDVSDLFAKEFRIQGGEGPDLEIFVAPSELTARFAWDDDNLAKSTISDLLGLGADDDPEAGIEGPELPGFVLTNDDNNQRNSLENHAKSVAAEALAAYADAIQGTVSTSMPPGGPRVVGNMAAADIHVGAFPSAKVSAVHHFPGQQRPISRFALMDEATRRIVLGTVNRD